jgi:hypothetical protein
MHTPRFSGQPAKAGDFVLTKTFSRPMRTSCENVGTVVLFICDREAVNMRAQNFSRLSQGAQTEMRESTHLC